MILYQNLSLVSLYASVTTVCKVCSHQCTMRVPKPSPTVWTRPMLKENPGEHCGSLYSRTLSACKVQITTLILRQGALKQAL